MVLAEKQFCQSYISRLKMQILVKLWSFVVLLLTYNERELQLNCAIIRGDMNYAKPVPATKVAYLTFRPNHYFQLVISRQLNAFRENSPGVLTTCMQ